MRIYPVASIVQRYKLGESSRKIAKDVGCNTKTICDILRQEGITPRRLIKGVNSISPEAIRLYESGKSTNEIAKLLSVSPSTVIRFLKNNGVQIKDPQKSHRRTTIDEFVFDDFNELSEYWAGFLAADGCIRRHSIMLALSSVDEEHISKFMNFMKSNGKVACHRSVRANGSVVLSSKSVVTSSHVVNRLISLGITERKTKTLVINEHLSLSRHFWRGYTDGDGHIAITPSKNEPMFQISSKSRRIMEQFLEFLRSNGIGDHLSLHVTKHPVYRIATSSRVAQSIVKLLYLENNVALARKQAVATFIIGMNHWYKPYVHHKPPKAILVD